MRSKIARAAIACAAALAAACSEPEPRIDMSTTESTARSMAEVRDSLSAAEQQRFNQATTALVLHAVGPDRDAASKSPEKSQAAVKAALDGKTAQQVITAADAIKAAPPAAAP